jgi:hypothetical protein
MFGLSGQTICSLFVLCKRVLVRFKNPRAGNLYPLANGVWFGYNLLYVKMIEFILKVELCCTANY